MGRISCCDLKTSFLKGFLKETFTVFVHFGQNLMEFADTVDTSDGESCNVSCNISVWVKSFLLNASVTCPAQWSSSSPCPGIFLNCTISYTFSRQVVCIGFLTHESPRCCSNPPWFESLTLVQGTSYRSHFTFGKPRMLLKHPASVQDLSCCTPLLSWDIMGIIQIFQ